MINLFGWQGKVFDGKRGLLKNSITIFHVQAIVARVYKGPSWLDGKECIVLDYSRRSFVARKVRDEIREVAPGLFLGLAFWGRQHVLDFALDFTRRR